MINKNDILKIVAAIGTFLTFIFGFIGGIEPSIILIILTVSVLASIFFFYENPKGENCTPKNADPTVITWVTNNIGECVPSKCISDYYVIKNKCKKPTDIPDGWKLVSSNGFTSNILTTSSTLTSNASCGYICNYTEGCNIASFSTIKGCTLYTHDDSADKSVDDKTPSTLIIRPTKKTS